MINMKRIPKTPYIIAFMIILLFGFIPDPTDILDAGTPIIETIVATAIYTYGKGMWGKKW